MELELYDKKEEKKLLNFDTHAYGRLRHRDKYWLCEGIGTIRG